MSPGIVAESDLTGSLTSEYVFFNGERVARKDFPSNAVSYYFSDRLKTASVITDSAGNFKEDEDFFPYGGEVKFVDNDPNHYKFTGHERDGETGLDYFGARHYSNPLGRFMTPDLSEDPFPLVYAEFSDPQTLNLYNYARNNPLRFADPDGHDYHVCGPDGGDCKDLTNDQYDKWRRDNPQVKQRLDGTLEHCAASGCTTIGSASYFNPQDVAGLALLALTSRVTDKYIATPLVTFLSLAVPGALVSTMPEASAGIGVAIVSAATKQAAKAAVEDAAMTAAQKAAVKRAIARATTKSTISVERLADGTIRVLIKRPGANGFQVVSKIVSAEGTTSAVQVGVDASGEVTHYDPKY
jgi:RHS repeat-associated protein